MKKAVDRNGGFTLVEIAIVLVVIGLLLGGILKGQELINNAKVRAIADRQNSLKVAWFSFVDRYGAIPGNYVRADFYITGAAAGDGDGLITEREAPLVFQHLTAAGYLRCGHCTSTNTFVSTLRPAANNSLINNYGGVMSIWHDSVHYAFPTRAISGGVANVQRLMVHTGPRIPSNILAEVDRKIDDGIPNTGDMRFNNYDPTRVSQPPVGQCTKANGMGTLDGTLEKGTAGANFWRPAGSTPPVFQNCGASVMI